MATRFHIAQQQEYSPYKSPYEKGNGGRQDQQLLSTNAKSGYLSNGGENDQLRMTVNSNQAQPLKFSSASLNQSTWKSKAAPLKANDLDQSRMPPNQSMLNQSVMNETQYKNGGGVGEQRGRSTQNNEDPRDSIIKNYQEEIQMHKSRSRDFEKLQQLITELRYKSLQLEEQLSTGQLRQPYEQQLQQQSKQIEHLQRECEMLKREIADKHMEGLQVADGIQRAKSEVMAADEQQYFLQKDLDKQQVLCDLNKRELDMGKQSLGEAHEVRQSQQKSISGKRNEGRNAEKDVKEQQAMARDMEKECQSNAERIKIMNEHLEGKQQKLEEVSYQLYKTSDSVSQLQKQNEMLDLQISEVEASNQRQVEAQKRLFRQKEQEGVRGQESVHQLQSNDQRIRELDSQLDRQMREAEGVRGNNDVLYERNGDLAVEVKELSRHCEVLLQQNKELQNELDSFVAQDEMIRHNLDRKDKVGMIRSKVDDIIKRSEKELMQKSPQRKRNLDQSYQPFDQSYRSPY